MTEQKVSMGSLTFSHVLLTSNPVNVLIGCQAKAKTVYWRSVQ